MFMRIAVPLMLFFAPRFLPHILRFARLVWRLSFDKRVPLLLRLLLPVAIIYAVSPFDLVPDRVPILGRFDDLIFIALALLLLSSCRPKRWWTNTTASPRRPIAPKTRTRTRSWTDPGAS